MKWLPGGNSSAVQCFVIFLNSSHCLPPLINLKVRNRIISNGSQSVHSGSSYRQALVTSPGIKWIFRKKNQLLKNQFVLPFLGQLWTNLLYRYRLLWYHIDSEVQVCVYRPPWAPPKNKNAKVLQKGSTLSSCKLTLLQV